MKFSLSPTVPKTDVLFILLEKGASLSPAAKTALGGLKKEVELRLKDKEFEGEEGQSLMFFGDGQAFKRVYLMGMGEDAKHLPQAVEKLGGSLVALAKGAKAKKAAVMVSSKYLADLSHGSALGAYEFVNYKTKDKKEVPFSEITWVSEVNKDNERIIKNASLFASCSPLTRDLINMPTADMTTKDMETQARKLARDYKMKVTVMNETQLRKAGCHALAGVGQGAEETARLIFLEYKNGSKSSVPSLAFVGKGVVFDTGGLNLKPTGYMETMKQDMAGAATVLGTMKAIAEAKLKGHYLGVLACAENAVSEKAQRPGDVVKAYNGKTIEITNTDAEGRLCLADALAYTEKNYKPKAMIDIATLTGAVSVALGHFITGVMGNNQALIDETMDAGAMMGERMWQLPLTEDFVKATKGDFTDLKNSTSGVKAGATMGAAFLKNFVDKTPWVHLDIGGTAWCESSCSTTKYGATAVCLRTFLELARRHQG